MWRWGTSTIPRYQPIQRAGCPIIGRFPSLSLPDRVGDRHVKIANGSPAIVPTHDILPAQTSFLAPPVGFEPTTHGLGNRCSIP